MEFPTPFDIREFLPELEKLYGSSGNLERLKRIFATKHNYQEAMYEFLADVNWNIPVDIEGMDHYALYFPELTPKNWWKPEEFDWTESISKSFEIIQKELLQVLEEDSKKSNQRKEEIFSNYNEYSLREEGLIDKEGDWKAMFLFDRGVKVQENCKRFPETTRLMETIPRRMGDVFFSFLNPKSLIKFHTGPLNVKVTAHLPLIVPKKSSPSDTRSCRMQVGSETKEFKEGKWLIFSDSFPHRVFNDLDTRRVVLIIDVWHKGITDVEVKCLEHIMQKIQGQQENKGFVNSVKNFLGIKKT